MFSTLLIKKGSFFVQVYENSVFENKLLAIADLLCYSYVRKIYIKLRKGEIANE